MTRPVLHLHTYFLFPFVVERELVAEAHPEYWRGNRTWIDGIDEFVHAESLAAAPRPLLTHLGPWRRASYDRFDLDSPAYQDMVFFHPFVRRVFFDVKAGGNTASEQDTMVRCYEMPLPADGLQWTASVAGRSPITVAVTDLRLFLFANGVGLLSLGVEKQNLPFAEALWINEMFRKVYPTSGRQRREGRIPHLSRLHTGQTTLVEESFEHGELINFQPPLTRILRDLLYPFDYHNREFEQIFDERMIVYSYAAVDPDRTGESYVYSDELQVMLSRFLYVDRAGEQFRYDPVFLRRQMEDHLYTRWAHEGTYYGFTRYSNVTLALGVSDRGDHLAREGALIHRMFDTRYYLMAVVASFYRASLLDFTENIALVSRRIFLDLQAGALTRQNMEIATDLRSDFLNFSNYWLFSELANKDEEIEHFELQCRAFRIDDLRKEIREELESMNASILEFNQSRSTDAVNRLAVLSMIFGAGAVLTGFFGMNFGREFAALFFAASPGREWVHYSAVAAVSLIALATIAFGVYLVASNWRDYRYILRGRLAQRRAHRWFSIRNR